jgi:hypothetical protein
MVALICIEPPHQATHWNAGRGPRRWVSRCARCNAFGRRTSRRSDSWRDLLLDRYRGVCCGNS